MRYAIIAVGVIALALSGTALAQPSGGIEIGVTPRDPTDPNPPSAPPSDPKPYDGGVIEVNPGDVETIRESLADFKAKFRPGGDA